MTLTNLKKKNRILDKKKQSQSHFNFLIEIMVIKK